MRKIFYIVILNTVLASCGSKFDPFARNSDNEADVIAVPFSLEQDTSLALGDESSDLNLAPSTATNIFAAVEGCLSGNSPGIQAVSGTINVYKGDRSCLVKLKRFTLGSTTYASVGGNAVPFTTWLTGNTATFQSIASNSDIIRVFVVTQVTQSGVLGGDTVSYKFTDIQSGTSSNLATASVQTGVPLSATGQEAPNYTIAAARFLAANTDGSADLSFTAHCGATVTGSAGAYSCSSQLQSQMDYILTPDIYSQGAITVAQATAAFVAATPTPVASGNQVGAGGSDLNSNVLTRGGFYTSNASPLVTGTTPIAPNNFNHVFIIRRKDASGNAMSFRYFYVNITPAFGTTVACTAIFAGGSGASTDPYQVSSSAALAKINTGACASSSVYFRQVNNIDLGGSGSPWTAVSLTGQYDGGGFKITGLYQNISSGVGGLFATMSTGSSVSNLTVENVSITTTSQSAGALVASLVGTATVTSCSASGTITSSAGTPSLGGLVGGNQAGTSISASSSSVNITFSATTTGAGPRMGGIVGLTNGGSGTASISNSFATGNFTLTNTNAGNTTQPSVGGLLGQSITAPISFTNSWSTVNITISSGSFFGTTPNAMTCLGGIVGQTSGATTITGCFSAGTITATGAPNGGWFAGIVGAVNNAPQTVSYSYTMTTIAGGTTATTLIGGFFSVLGGASGLATVNACYSASPSLTTGAGSIFGFTGTPANTTVTNSYLYDNASVPSQTLTGLTSYTTSGQMQTYSNFPGLTFGNSANNWQMPSANPLSPGSLLSPVQYWQCGDNGIVCDQLSVTNGGFESGTYTGGSFQTLSSGSTIITGWTVGGASVDWASTIWTPSEGTKSLELNGSGVGSMSQVLTTVPGNSYTVSFDLAGNTATGGSCAGTTVLKSIYVTAANATQNYSFDVTGKGTSTMGWTTKTFTFTATSTSTTLTFTSGTAGSCGPVIDNVR